MTKKGYILPLTIMLISVAVILVTSIVQKSSIYQKQARIAFEREQARTIALSAVQLALSKISIVVPKEKEAPRGMEAPRQGEGAQKVKNEGKTNNEQKEPLQEWLLQFISILNSWHTIQLTENEGLNATITFYLASEQGKFNIEYLSALLKGNKQKQEDKETQKKETAEPNNKEQKASQKEHAEKKEAQKVEFEQKRNPLEVLDEFMKKNGINLQQMLKEIAEKFKIGFNDVTQLVLLKSVSRFKDKLFPSLESKPVPKENITLTNLFTTSKGSGKLNPWLLSASVKAILGFKENNEMKMGKQQVKQIKPTTDWKTEWDKVLAPLYGKKFAAIPQEIQYLFNNEFEAQAFSFIANVTVGNVTQKIAALLELDEIPEDLSAQSKLFKITRFYWL